MSLGIVAAIIGGVIEYTQKDINSPNILSKRSYVVGEFFRSYLGNVLAGDFLIRTIPELLFNVNDGDWAVPSWGVTTFTIAVLFSVMRAKDAYKYRYTCPDQLPELEDSSEQTSSSSRCWMSSCFFFSTLRNQSNSREDIDARHVAIIDNDSHVSPRVFRHAIE